MSKTENFDFEMDLQDDKELYMDTAKKRLGKCCESKLIVKDGKAKLDIFGEERLCTRIEGYIKFPDTGIIMDIKQAKFILLLHKKNKLILIYNNDEIICRGYKRANVKDFMLLLYVETELNYLLVMDITNGDIQPLFLTGDTDNDDNISEILYNQFKYTIEKEIDVKQPVIEDL